MAKKQQTDLPKLSAPAQRALAAAGIQHLEDVTQFSESEILALHGVGPSTIPPLRNALAANGLAFAAEKKKKA